MVSTVSSSVATTVSHHYVAFPLPILSLLQPHIAPDATLVPSAPSTSPVAVLTNLSTRPAADASKDMAATPFNTAMPNAGQPQDYNKLFKAEKDNLEFAEGLYKWAGEDVETRVLRKYGRL